MKAIALAALLLTASGCFHLHYVTGEPPAPAPTSEKWHNGFVWGLVEGDASDVGAACSSGRYARVDSTETFVNGLVHAITFSIYTPETVTITCSASDAAQVPQSPTRPWPK